MDLTRIPPSHRLYSGFTCSDPSLDKFPVFVISSCGLRNFLLRATSGCRVQSQGMDTAVWFKFVEILIEGVNFKCCLSVHVDNYTIIVSTKCKMD
jgi:hypothetical protein